MKPRLLIIVGLVLVFAALVHLVRPAQYKANDGKSSQNPITSTGPVPPQFPDKTFFLSAIVQNTQKPATQNITGITVPHHLLAVDLIASAFAFAGSSTPDTVLLISPDHFNLGTTDVSVSERDFLTVFGKINANVAAVKKLEQLPFVTPQNFFYREHGLGAELPFINYYFPKASIIALTFKETTSKTELEQTVAALKNIITPKTLIIQSTDFSHYLTPQNAEMHDEQTLKILNDNNAEELFSLTQPDNLDSLACQYIQTRLQKEFFASSLKILGHKNSQGYTTEPITSTTSYIVQAYLSN